MADIAQLLLGIDARGGTRGAAEFERAGARIMRTSDQIVARTKPIAKSFNDTAAAMTKAGKSMRDAGKTLMMRVTLPVAAAGAAVLKMGGDFEFGMNRVKALSRLIGDTSGIFEELRTQAKNLGATTMFTATQASEGMGFLAMAGFEAKEIFEVMPATLELAAAATLDLGRAADLVTNILTGYGMEVGELQKASDILTATFTSSNTTMEMLGESFKYVGPVAKDAGLKFQETAALIGTLGNAGVQASMAGTSLRMALVKLMDQSDDAAATLNRLGVEVLDTDGNLKNFIHVIGQLEAAGASASDVMKIFGVRAGPAVRIFMAQGAEAITKYADMLEKDVGASGRVAAVTMEGFKGQMVALKSAIEGLAISIAESGVLQYFTELAKRLTAYTRELVKTDPEKLRQIATFAGIAALGGPALMALGLMTTGVGMLLKTVSSLVVVLPKATGMLMAFATTPIGMATIAAGATLALFMSWVREINKSHEAMLKVVAAEQQVKILASDILLKHKEITQQQVGQLLNRVHFLKAERDQIEKNLAKERERKALFSEGSSQRLRKIAEYEKQLQRVQNELNVLDKAIKNATLAESKSNVVSEEAKQAAAELKAALAALALEMDEVDDRAGEFAKSLDEVKISLDDLIAAEKQSTKDLEGLEKAHRQGADAVREHNALVEARETLVSNEVEATEENVKALAQEIVAREKANAAVEDTVEELNKKLTTMEELIEVERKAKTDLDNLTEAHKKGAEAVLEHNARVEARETLIRAEIEATEENIKKLAEEIIAREKAAAAADKAGEKTKESARTTTNEIEQIQENFLKSVQGEFAETFEQIFSGNLKGFEDLFDAVYKLFLRMLAQMAAAALAKKIFVNVDVEGSGGSTGGFLSGLKRLFGGGGGGGEGAAATGGKAAVAATIGATLLAFYAVYKIVDKILERKKAKAVIGQLELAIEDMQVMSRAWSGMIDLNEALLSAVKAIRDGLLEIEKLTGGRIANMPKIQIDVRGNGTITAMVNGIVIGVFEDLEQAVNAAVITALKQAELVGAHDAYVQVLKNTAAKTMEELFADLSTAARLVALEIGEARVAIQGGFSELWALFEEGARLGISFETRAKAMVSGLKQIRDEILGITAEDYADRLLAAKEFNDQLDKSLDRLKEIANRQGPSMPGPPDRPDRGGTGVGDDGYISPTDQGGGGRDDDGGLIAFGGALEQLDDTFSAVLPRLRRNVEDAGDVIEDLPDKINLVQFAQRLINEFAGLDTVTSQMLSIRETADRLRDAIEQLGLSADQTAKLLKRVEEAEKLRMQQLETDVLQRLVNVMSQIPGYQKEAAALQAKIDQARFKIEIEMIRIQLKALDLMTRAFRRMLRDARDFSDDVNNFRQLVPKILNTPDFDGGVPRPRGGGRQPRFDDRPTPRFFHGGPSREELREQVLDFLRKYEMSKLQLALFDLGARFRQLAADARKAGISEERLAAVRRKAVDEIRAEFLSPLADLRTELKSGKLAAASPIAGFHAKMEEFKKVRAMALAGDEDSIRNFAGTARDLLEIAGSLFGTSGGFYQSLVEQIAGDTDKLLIEGNKLFEDTMREIANISFRQLTTLEQILNALEGRQHGGPVRGGRAYMVGEGGPELFMPNEDGEIVANHMLSRGRMHGNGLIMPDNNDEQAVVMRTFMETIGKESAASAERWRQESELQREELKKLRKEMESMNSDLRRTLSVLEAKSVGGKL